MAAELATEVILNVPSKAITANDTSVDLDVSRAEVIQVDIDVTVAGVSPTVTIERKSPNGIYFPVLTSAAIGVGKATLTVGYGSPDVVNVSKNQLPGQVIRVTVTSTSATYSMTVYGR